MLVCLQPAEALGGFHHASGRPTQSHPGIAPPFDVAADAANGAVHILDDVGAGYPSGEGRLFAEDVIVNIEGAAGTMIVSV